jgi:hypothetical protein
VLSFGAFGPNPRPASAGWDVSVGVTRGDTESPFVMSARFEYVFEFLKREQFQQFSYSLFPTGGLVEGSFSAGRAVRKHCSRRSRRIERRSITETNWVDSNCSPRSTPRLSHSRQSFKAR